MGWCNISFYCISPMGWCNISFYCISRIGWCNISVYCISPMRWCNILLYCISPMGWCNNSVYCISAMGWCNISFYYIIPMGWCNFSLYCISPMECSIYIASSLSSFAYYGEFQFFHHNSGTIHVILCCDMSNINLHLVVKWNFWWHSKWRTTNGFWDSISQHLFYYINITKWYL